MKISVIIPTLNCENVIGLLLEKLWNQTMKPLEVIVIDSESDDKTREVARKGGANVIKIKRKDFNHGGTRNLAAEHSAGDILVFLTQDALPRNEYFLENLIKPLEDPMIAASYGRQVPRDEAIPTEKFSRLFNYPPEDKIKSKDEIKTTGIKTFFFTNVCSAIKKKEFYEVGKFPDNTILNEDMILASKLILKGYKIAYVSTAEVLHSHNYGLKKQFQRNFDIGVSLIENDFILKYVSAESEGIRFLINELKYLIEKKQFFWIPYAITENGSRFIGYRLGLKHKSIPLFLKKKLSMNPNYWVRRND
ncbi:glycosyltransferase family 2 protein [Thermoanaerobacter thermocopriae]|uniref:glycosyltransferase family 2 protein n=2 Tax=Thermoanaerobacter thermocopriae TaxID=29350 RepID=UPI00048AE687|nr:glycosyltransferase family 2 protein [Thermoanaerobacter thermocopriae]